MSVIHRIVFDMINKQKSVFDPKHWPDYQKRRENEAGQTSALKPPKGVEICPDTLAGVPVEWVSCEKGSNDILMLYIHGGGFVGGSAEANRVFTGYCAKEWGWKALAVNYRLAPEHPFPAGLEDCLAVYRELLKNYDAERIVFCGGSAGGNLVLALELMARDQGLPAPAAILSASPTVQYTDMLDSYTKNLDTDCMVTNLLEEIRAVYFQSDDPKVWANPYGAPYFGDFTGGCPVVFISSEAEVLWDDTCLMAEKLRQQGVKTEVISRPGMLHAYAMLPILPEAKEDLKKVKKILDGWFVFC